MCKRLKTSEWVKEAEKEIEKNMKVWQKNKEYIKIPIYVQNQICERWETNEIEYKKGDKKGGGKVT